MQFNVAECLQRLNLRFVITFYVEWQVSVSLIYGCKIFLEIVGFIGISLRF